MATKLIALLVATSLVAATAGEAWAQDAPATTKAPKKKKKGAAPAAKPAAKPAAGAAVNATATAPSADVTLNATAPSPPAASVGVGVTAPKTDVSVTANAGAPKSELVATGPGAPAASAAVVVPENEGADRPGFSLAAFIGFESGGFGFSLGARAGYTFRAPHLYVGGEFDYGAGSGGIHVFNIRPEVGYDIALPISVPILIRPYLGLGVGVVSDGPVSVAAFVFAPGVEAFYDITPNVFLGLDLRVPVYTAGGSTATFAAYLTGGYKF
jgi:hypothetical protein